MEVGTLDGILAIAIGALLVPFDMVRRYWEKEETWFAGEAAGDSLWGREERMLAQGQARRAGVCAEAASIATRACPLVAAPLGVVAIMGAAYSQVAVLAS